MGNRKSELEDHFGIQDQNLNQVLSVALAKGGDYAELYLEYRTRESLNFEEGILKSASTNISEGIGIRVIHGEKTG